MVAGVVIVKGERLDSGSCWNPAEAESRETDVVNGTGERTRPSSLRDSPTETAELRAGDDVNGSKESVGGSAVLQPLVGESCNYERKEAPWSVQFSKAMMIRGVMCLLPHSSLSASPLLFLPFDLALSTIPC